MRALFEEITDLPRLLAEAEAEILEREKDTCEHPGCYQPTNIGSRHCDEHQTGLAVRTTVKQLVAGFVAATVEIRECYARLHKVEGRLTDLFIVGGESYKRMRIEGRHHHDSIDWTDPDGSIEKLKRQAWGVIAERLEVRRALSIRAAKALDEKLERGDLPDLTEENIWAWFKPFAASIEDTFREAIIEVFDWLRPREHYGDCVAKLKTNQKNAKLEIGRKIIVSGVAHRGYGRSRFRVGDWASPRLRALENVFSMLDGQGGIGKTYYSEIENQVQANENRTGIFDTRYFKGRLFGNTNMHMEFKRLDLLARFNMAAGGANLKPGVETE